MAVNVYIMPAIGSGTSHDMRRAKYTDDFVAAGVPSSQRDYGLEPVFLVGARDVPDALHQTIAADPACTVVPDLSQTVGGQLNTVKNKLEALNIPAGWVQSSHSYGSVVRVVYIFFLLAQRLHGLTGARLFASGVTMDTRFNQLPQAARQALLDMANSFNFNTSALSGASTMRAILKALADQWPNLSLPLGGLTL